MVQKKSKNKSKDSGKTAEAKSAAAGKIQKSKSKSEEKATIISKIAENVQKVMETTTTDDKSNKKRKQEKELNDNAAGNNIKSESGKKDDQKKKKQQKNKKQQKKNLDAPKKGKKTFNKVKKEEASKGTDPGDTEAKWSKSKKKRLRALKAKQLKKQQQGDSSSSKSPSSNPEENTAATAAAADASSVPTTSAGSSSKLQNSFKARLSGSRFRILNEELYTKDSKDSFARFSKNPELFEQYHEGFRQQASSWPVNPVDVIVKWITKRFSSQIQNHAEKQKTAKSKNKKIVVADFGCGDAQLAQDLMQRHPDAFHVHSFDLVSSKKNNHSLVTACDMANVPSASKSVDVVVFCLALMGTNLADFIREAHRVLKDNGRVQIAEVRSRIEYSHGRSSKKGSGADNKNKKGDGNDTSLTGTLEEFVTVLSQLGFECAKTDRSNKMFLFLELKKNGNVPDQTLNFSAKPCIYKRR
ncbi:MAG: hypothetical protein SGBAC_003205 [Bacillariaceae sp.]